MILIAGGAGYIGSHANKILNKRGFKTVVYDNLSRGHREFAKWGHFVLGDLADKDQLRHCFKTYPIDAVMLARLVGKSYTFLIPSIFRIQYIIYTILQPLICSLCE